MLFVNVSIGGTLTAYAAPPVLMVATAWGWDSTFMATQLGWNAAVVVLVNATVLIALMRGALAASGATGERVPAGVTLIHVGFLVGVVLGAHHPVVFIGLLLFFLGGLVVLSGLQQWWLQPIVASMDAYALYAGALGLTVIANAPNPAGLAIVCRGFADESISGAGRARIAGTDHPMVLVSQQQVGAARKLLAGSSVFLGAVDIV
ncbi:putative Na+/H+ antiporter [Burkholderia pyrrocinia]|uniref:Putative Na+/H+ antiporter n=2 Tax=Burkholderia TaxID=32008 RepID=A0A318I8K9_BURPY|nr:putative Na+/H+ antiporter [Burkholderia pyrrocinia]SFY46598.1 Putative Na+/H+ antiporter [Burkholderia sp. NFPP32]